MTIKTLTNSLTETLRNCKTMRLIEDTRDHHITMVRQTRMKPRVNLLRKRKKKCLVGSEREKHMGALRRIQPSTLEDFHAEKTVRTISPAEYADEITDDQLNEIEKLVADGIGSSDEWHLVGGPAW